MSAIFLPRRWRHQPIAGVEIDRRHPIGAKVHYAYTPWNGLTSITAGKRSVTATPTASTLARSVGPNGQGARILRTGSFSGVGIDLDDTEFTATASTGGAFFFLVDGLTYGNSSECGLIKFHTGDTLRISSNASGRTLQLFLFSNARLTGSEPIPDGYTGGIGVSGETSDSVSTYVGRKTDIVLQSTGGYNVRGTSGIRAVTVGYPTWNCPLFVRADYLTHDEMRELNDAPWTIFRAPSHRIWFDVGAGASGTTYNESLTESATLGDGLDPIASFFASYAESVTAGDSADNAQTHAVALSESVTPADSATSAQSHAETLAESVTADDSAEPAQTMPVAFSEGVTAGDALADEVVPAGSFHESRTESTLVDDAYAHAQTHVAAFLEQVAPGDDYAVTGGTEIVTKRRGAGGSPRGYVARIGGRLVYADTLQALQAAIAQFEASIPARAEKKAQRAGKVVVRRLPKVEVVEAPAEDQGATRAAAQAANDRIAAEYIAALQAQIAIRAAMEAAERDDMEAITVLELL